LLSLRSKNSNFRWKETIDTCWIIADFEGTTIYYASPQLDNNTIPNYQWISVHGSKPLPTLSNNPNHSSHTPVSPNNTNSNNYNNRHHNRKNNNQHRSNSNLPTTIHENNNENNEEDEESPLSDIE